LDSNADPQLKPESVSVHCELGIRVNLDLDPNGLFALLAEAE